MFRKLRQRVIDHLTVSEKIRGMRVIYEVIHPQAKISVFSFNEKWIVKTEAGLCEQTYKIPQAEFDLETIKRACVDPKFLDAIHARFEVMHHDWLKGLESE